MKALFAIPVALMLLTLWSCEREIDIDLPDSESKLVVEGSIENGSSPFVLVTRSQGYFEPTTPQALSASVVKDARVTVLHHGQEYPLQVYCASTLPEEYQVLLASIANVPVESLGSLDVCIYTVPLDQLASGSALQGEVGERYDLRVEHAGNVYTATTTIPEPILLDTFRFEIRTDDRFGHIMATLYDPAEPGNAYRWFHQRLSQREEHAEPFPISPLVGGLSDDQFFNGQKFEFEFRRGEIPYVEESWTSTSAPGYFTTGDTVVSKFCTIDRAHYAFWNSYQRQVFGGDNPFAAPSDLVTNIQGGALGVWGGYGVSYDTVICIP